MKPTPEEAKIELANIRVELGKMREIQSNAAYLSQCDDVDAPYYKSIAIKVEGHINSGSRLEKHILDLYPELR